MSSSLRTALESLQIAIQHEFPGSPPLEEVRVLFLGGKKLKLAVFGHPCPAPPRAAEAPEPPIAEWLALVVDALTAAGKRLTTSQLFTEMSSREMIFSESTVTKGLAKECKTGDVINSRKDSYGTGYGLAEWS
jgi:hypothetical protein